MGLVLRALLIIAAFMCFSVSAFDTSKNIELLEEKLQLEQSDRLNILVELVWLYRNNRTEQALRYGTEALELLTNSPNPELEAKVLHSMAWAQMREGEYVSANEFAIRALDISESNNLEEAKSFSLNVLGAIDWYKGDFLGALDYFLSTLDIRLKLGQQYDIASAYNNIGSVYQEINEYEKALEYHFLSLQLKQSFDDPYSLATSLFNISIIYQRLNNEAKELLYLEKALTLFRSINDKEAITGAEISLAELKLKSKNISVAEKLFDSSLKSATSLANQSFIVKAKLGKSKIEIAREHYDKALAIALECLELSKKLDEKTQIRDTYQVLFTIYQATGDFQRALESYKQYISIRDEILKGATEGQLAMLQHQFDKKQADNQIKILVKEKILNELTIKQAETEKLYLFYGLLLGALLGTIILYQLFKLDRKNKQFYEISITDNLCQCFNRYYLFNQLLSEIIEQEKAIFSILIDIDHFKLINDNYGHSVGDRVLLDFCGKIKNVLDDSCYLVRLGGEEFLVIGYQNEEDASVELADRIKKAISENTFKLSDSESLTVTCSIGVASGMVVDENSIAELIKKSDAAMYRAKKQGRDKIVYAKR